jgi:transposase
VARRERADAEWFERYARRMEDQRLPKGNKAREQYLKAGRPKPTKAKTSPTEAEVRSSGPWSRTRSELERGDEHPRAERRQRDERERVAPGRIS